jgi:hypothetical protein
MRMQATPTPATVHDTWGQTSRLSYDERCR